MSKKPKKPAPSGKHKTPRRAIPLPEQWVDLVDAMAGKRKRPTSWLVIELIQNLAKEDGLPTPPAPWDKTKADEDADN